jgi:NitT/TauT family transport system substrate-binding protein
MRILLYILLFCFSFCHPSKETLKFGANLWPGYEPFFIADAKGKFMEQPIHLVEFSSATEVIRSYRNDQINSAGLTIDEVLYLKKYSKNPRIVMILDISNGADILVAQSYIENIQSLKGKKIGVENTALGAYVLYRFLESSNLKVDDVEVIHLEVHEQVEYFQSKKIDAVITFFNKRAAFLSSKGKILFDSSQLKGEIMDVLLVEDSYLQKNRSTVKTFMKVWFDFLSSQAIYQEQYLDYIAKREGTTKSDIKESIQRLIIPGVKENLEMLVGKKKEFRYTAEKLALYMYEKKLVSERYEVSEIIDSSLLEEILIESK